MKNKILLIIILMTIVAATVTADDVVYDDQGFNVSDTLYTEGLGASTGENITLEQEIDIVVNTDMCFIGYIYGDDIICLIENSLELYQETIWLDEYENETVIIDPADGEITANSINTNNITGIVYLCNSTDCFTLDELNTTIPNTDTYPNNLSIIGIEIKNYTIKLNDGTQVSNNVTDIDTSINGTKILDMDGFDVVDGNIYTPDGDDLCIVDFTNDNDLMCFEDDFGAFAIGYFGVEMDSEAEETELFFVEEDYEGSGDNIVEVTENATNFSSYAQNNFFENDIVVDDEVKILNNGSFWTYGRNTSVYGRFAYALDRLVIYTQPGGTTWFGASPNDFLGLNFKLIYPTYSTITFAPIFGNSTHRFQELWFGDGDFSGNLTVGENTTVKGKLMADDYYSGLGNQGLTNNYTIGTAGNGFCWQSFEDGLLTETNCTIS